MVLHENSDIIQWGLRLLDGDPIYSPGYYGDIVQHDTGNIYDGNYYHRDYDADSNHIENDEMIARTLQEEFSQLDIAESSGYSQENEEHYHAPELAYGWHKAPMINHFSEDHDYVQEVIDDEEHSSSCSSPFEGGEYSLELTDPLNDEAGRRLSQMTTIPHVPRINGDIPSIDEATSDHQRLLDRLQIYDFVERKVPGDGNCQFHALSDQLYDTPEYHKLVRQQAVNQLKSHPEIYEGYVPMEYGEYLEKMSKGGEWGDHVTLQAVADSYGVKIFLITSFKDTCCIEILPHFEKPKKGEFYSRYFPELLGRGALQLHMSSRRYAFERVKEEEKVVELWEQALESGLANMSTPEFMHNSLVEHLKSLPANLLP